MRALIAPLVATLAACASGPPTVDATPAPPGADGAHTPPVRDGATGARISFDEARARLAAHRVIFVSERHADLGYQAVQREVLEHVHRVGPVALGVEWLPAEAQPAIDRWLAGAAPIGALAEAVDWPSVWGHDLAAYAPILLWARRHGAPVIGLNAPPGLAQAVARHGADGVPDHLAGDLPPLDSADDAHFARFAELMRGAGAHHAHGELDDESLRRYYAAQLVWDESMARRAAAWLDAPAAEGRRLVVFAGGGHVDFGHGIPLRLRALTGLGFTIVRPFHADERGSLGPWPSARGAEWPSRRADVLWQTP